MKHTSCVAAGGSKRAIKFACLPLEWCVGKIEIVWTPENVSDFILENTTVTHASILLRICLFVF